MKRQSCRALAFLRSGHHLYSLLEWMALNDFVASEVQVVVLWEYSYSRDLLIRAAQEAGFDDLLRLRVRARRRGVLRTIPFPIERYITRKAFEFRKFKIGKVIHGVCKRPTIVTGMLDANFLSMLMLFEFEEIIALDEGIGQQFFIDSLAQQTSLGNTTGVSQLARGSLEFFTALSLSGTEEFGGTIRQNLFLELGESARKCDVIGDQLGIVGPVQDGGDDKEEGHLLGLIISWAKKEGINRIVYYAHRKDVNNPERKQLPKLLKDIDQTIEISTFEGGFEHHISRGQPLPSHLVSNFSTVSLVCSYLPLPITNFVVRRIPKNYSLEQRLHFKKLGEQFESLVKKGLNVKFLREEDLGVNHCDVDSIL